jgi:hypothetical protein
MSGRKTEKRQQVKVTFCPFLELRKVNGQKSEKGQNLEDGEKSGLVQISQ